MRAVLSVSIVLLGFLAAVGTAAASDSEADRVSLTGLSPISVVVEGLPPVATQNGVTTAALQADTEQRLKLARIAVTPDADAYLYVHVTVADPGAASPLPYFVEVSLVQEVTLPRGLKTRTPVQCPTWSLNRIGLISPGVLKAAVNDRVAEFVDQFIRAYRTVNP